VGAARRTQQRSLAVRLLKWCLGAIFVWFALSVLVIFALRWIDPPTSAFMIEARAEEHAQRGATYRTDFQWKSLQHISPNAAIAVIASEDQQFPFHSGFDLNSIRESVNASEKGHRLRGASTISQQVAKNLFLWNGHSFIRKALEAWITVLMEAMWPKTRILEIYLNIIELGRGVYGVEAAAQRFYHKPATQLSPGEAALFAAVLPNPITMRVDRPSPYVLGRREEILAQMRALGGASYLRSMEKDARSRP
jgi:monofunctional glycosyltransferase